MAAYKEPETLRCDGCGDHLPQPTNSRHATYDECGRNLVRDPARHNGDDWKFLSSQSELRMTGDSMLKPPIPLSTINLPRTTNLFLNSPFEHLFKGSSLEIYRHNLPYT